MFRFLRSSLVLFMTLSAIGTTYALELDTVDKRLSYTFGYQYIKQFENRDLKIDTEAYSAAVNDVQQGMSMRMTKEEMNTEMQTYRKGLYKDVQDQADAALEAGRQFLEKNKNQPGVKVLPSGVQYIEHLTGAGASPSLNSKITVNYRGTLINGKEFDSSKPDKPASFELNGLIRGFQEALTQMKPGAKWTIFIPSELGYGVRGLGNNIGPHEPLIFDVELIAVE